MPSQTGMTGTTTDSVQQKVASSKQQKDGCGRGVVKDKRK